MLDAAHITKPDRNRALALSMIAFTGCFAVWTIFSIIGVAIKAELELSELQFGLLVATPVLTGSLSRLVLGVVTEKFGGRLIFTLQMLLTALATWMLVWASSYEMYLLAALGVGLAGGSFIIGVVYVSRWFKSGEQGAAFGFYGAGNVGAAVTTFVAPFVMVAYGWRGVAEIWAAGLALIGVVFFLLAKDDPDLVARRASGDKSPSFMQQFEPLKNLQVWRFSLYYFFVFGGFVALVLWLPHYLIEVYKLDITLAGMAATGFAVSASVFRSYGGALSERFGARKVMYWSLGFSALLLFMLSYPSTSYVIHGRDGDISFSTEIAIWPFVIITFALGFFMSLGKAAIYRHIPSYFPDHVGAVGGLVGMIGGLGGFVLPVVFGAALDLTGVYTSCFVVLFLLVGASLGWMHISIRMMERAAQGAALDQLPALPEMLSIHRPEHAGATRQIEEWEPENPEFWAAKGRRIANRNLWISIPALLLAFAVWMVWSVVVARLPAIGFAFTSEQLFWLAALPGLSGATLRIFYSFMAPIFGGRLWTTISTASLLLPAFGIGYAVQNPGTPYFIFLVLALLCGFGGGNFASSMANIAFFFPRAEKGNALALNAGLGNLGVSAMQALVPVVITVGIFGALGGTPQTLPKGGQLWMQNAGFIWVPFIGAATVAAWLGMNDLADAKASFKQQSIIFTRRHNWIMCVLYTGTFGSFIGFSAGFPLLAGLTFANVDTLRLVFLGPLVGALSRAGTGWISDRFGGARVTFWTFIGMIAATLAVIYFLGVKDQSGAFWGFFLSFMALFFLTGVGNASTFQMIPAIMDKEVVRLMPQLSGAESRRQIELESAAIIAFTSAIAAYGAFFIPKAYGASIASTGGPIAALWGFLGFYVICLVLTWVFYTRPGGLLREPRRDGAIRTAANV